MRRGTRTRLALGIYKDKIGMSAQLMVHGRRLEKRFPAETPLRAIRDWRDGERLKQQALCTESAQGTLQADVTRYLRTATAMPTYRQRVYDLQQWVTALGPNRPRATITAPELETVMAGWRTAGLAPQTVKLRRTALLRLYSVLDGRDAPNPVRRTTRPLEPQPEARAHSVALVLELLEPLPASEWRPRLRLLAFAGLPPKQLGALKPTDVDLVHATVRVPPRRKGLGVPGSLRPLTPQAVAAFEELDRLDAWGPFESWRLTKWFAQCQRQQNAARVAQGLPRRPYLRPYDLRHSFATWLYETVRDLETVARMLGHAGTSMTRRYAMRGTYLVDVSAIAKLGAVIGAVNDCPAGSSSGKERHDETRKHA